MLIILADDLGYSDIGCFGGEVHTPNLDSLANGGTRFTSFYNDARCCPSRASLLTGLYPHQAGIGAMNELTANPGYLGHIRETAPTISEVLQSAGYHTALFGKWHVSNTLQLPDHLSDLNRQSFPAVFSPIEQYPTRRGFETFWGDIWGVINYYSPFSLVDGETPVKELPADFYATDAINQHTAEYIKQQAGSDRPMFIYLAEHAPHWPLMAPAADIEKYRDQFNDGYDAVRHARYTRMTQMGIVDPHTAALPPTLGNGWKQLSPEERRFKAALFQTHAAMIDRLDQGLGPIFQALKETGKWDNTLIVFLSDNGASPERYEDAGYDRATIARDGKPINYHYNDLNQLAGDEHTWYYIGREWANVANTPYRKAKASQYNGGERTPMIVHWPNGSSLPAGGFVRARGHIIDLMPTILDAAGAQFPAEFRGGKPHPMQGTSLLPLLHGQTVQNYPPLFGEHEGGKSVITPDGYKLVRDRDEKEWHLYNLNSDETETKDLAKDESKRCADMEEMWNTWARQNYVLRESEHASATKQNLH